MKYLSLILCISFSFPSMAETSSDRIWSKWLAVQKKVDNHAKEDEINQDLWGLALEALELYPSQLNDFQRRSLEFYRDNPKYRELVFNFWTYIRMQVSDQLAAQSPQLWTGAFRGIVELGSLLVFIRVSPQGMKKLENFLARKYGKSFSAVSKPFELGSKGIDLTLQKLHIKSELAQKWALYSGSLAVSELYELSKLMNTMIIDPAPMFEYVAAGLVCSLSIESTRDDLSEDQIASLIAQLTQLQKHAFRLTNIKANDPYIKHLRELVPNNWSSLAKSLGCDQMAIEDVRAELAARLADLRLERKMADELRDRLRGPPRLKLDTPKVPLLDHRLRPSERNLLAPMDPNKKFEFEKPHPTTLMPVPPLVFPARKSPAQEPQKLEPTSQNSPSQDSLKPDFDGDDED